MRPGVRAALAAQSCAFLNAATSVASESLARRGIDASSFQSFLNYTALAVVYGALHARSLASRGQPLRQAASSLSAPLSSYALLALVDVEANYLIVKAFQFTNITSVSLLDACSIPAAMLFSRALLRRAYARQQLAAAAVVIAGLAVLVLADALCGAEGGGGSGPRPLLGDVLTLSAACLYAASNVLQEKLLGSAGQVEVLCCLGGLGALLSGVQCLLLERSTLRAAFAAAAAKPHGRGLLSGGLLAFAISMFGLYSLAPTALRAVDASQGADGGGAAVFNLHLLTSDLWAAAARALLFGGFGGGCGAAAFAVSLLVVAGGLGAYAAAESPPSQPADGSIRCASGEEAAPGAGDVGGAEAAAEGGAREGEQEGLLGEDRRQTSDAA